MDTIFIIFFDATLRHYCIIDTPLVDSFRYYAIISYAIDIIDDVFIAFHC
jgi:hypothetical protein